VNGVEVLEPWIEGNVVYERFGIAGVEVIFTRPFLLRVELARRLKGLVVVLDLAFNAGLNLRRTLDDLMGWQDLAMLAFVKSTRGFIEELGPRLIFWADHHPHPAWQCYVGDERFLLKERNIALACAQLLRNKVVREVRRPNVILAHGDFDGVMSAAFFLLNGRKPYPQAKRDSVYADARCGAMSLRGERYEKALKSNIRNMSLRGAMLEELVSSQGRSKDARKILDEAVEEYEKWILPMTLKLAKEYERFGIVNVVDVRGASAHFDLTELLTLGQKQIGKWGVAVVISQASSKGRARIAVSGNVKKWRFNELFGVGGASNRVQLGISRLDEVIEKCNMIGGE
jgi:hypothetical protein